jgi:hypothetical protein
MVVKYSNLSGALKTAVVLAYVTGVTYVIAFLVGFIAGVVGY